MGQDAAQVDGIVFFKTRRTYVGYLAWGLLLLGVAIWGRWIRPNGLIFVLFIWLIWGGGLLVTIAVRGWREPATVGITPQGLSLTELGRRRFWPWEQLSRVAAVGGARPTLIRLRPRGLHSISDPFPIVLHDEWNAPLDDIRRRIAGVQGEEALSRTA